MLDLGFIHALKRIAKLLPRSGRRCCSRRRCRARIAALAEEYLADPVRIAVAPAATTVERVEQSVIFVPSRAQARPAHGLAARPELRARARVHPHQARRRSRRRATWSRAGIDAAAIHGNKSQPQRERALAGFRNGNGRVLVATDIAARGIDVDDVSHVINFELPNVPEDYVHRIGRTARAGATGTAVAFCSDEERPHLRSIEKLTKLAVPVMPIPASLRDVHRDVHQGASEPPAASPSTDRRNGDTRHRQQPARARAEAGNAQTDALPAFLRRHPGSTRHAAPGRRPASRPKRMAAR